MDSQHSNTPQSSWKWLRNGIRVTSYWFNLVVQPVVAVALVIGLAWLFGYLQRNHGWFDEASQSVAQSDDDPDALYACSMLCVFVKSPGRCPVCGMELQKIEPQGDPKDLYGVTIDPVARRLANIQTVAALNMPMPKSQQALGQVTYNETTEATVAAWVSGRIEDLQIDFTGARINKGDELAVIYSPDLYSDQVGLMQAKQALQTNSDNQRVNRANQRLYESARQRLIEQGMPESQVDAIEAAGKPDRRIKVYAPGTGTVVEKLVEEGEFVKTGQPIFKIANLSTVWLKLELFPEDVGQLKLGQPVTVQIQSQPGEPFQGKIAFIAPSVNPRTQTVSVRVEIPNDAGLIKIGDLGEAKINTANGVDQQWVVVPRESVLINGDHSVVYVETEPGRFEFRKVKIGDILGDKISIASGIEPGELVVSSGTLMLDSTFNIQGKVSLIDPNRAILKNESQLAENQAEAKEIEESFKNLSPEDRKLAEQQVICPVTEVKLGTMGMGAPIRISLKNRDVMICCAGCETNLRNDPEKYYAVLKNYREPKPQAPQTGTTDPSPPDLPQLDLPTMELPRMSLPNMEDDQ